MHRFIYIAIIILSGCTTALLAPDYQEEWIDGFYVNEERGELFVSARNSGYIFRIDQEFREVLRFSRTTQFSPLFGNFSIDRKNNITGTLSLVLIDDGLGKEGLLKLEGLGFKEDELLRKLRMSRELKGKRYEIEGELPLEKLKKKRRVMIAVPDSYSVLAGKIIATPATITFDGVVSVPAAFLGAAIMQLGSP